MKINMNQIKEKIAGFIFDLIIESGSKSKFFRKYTNHRFRKQYERWEGNAAYRIYKRNNVLEKENSELYKRISTLNTRLRSIYDKVKVVATEYPTNAPCPHEKGLNITIALSEQIPLNAGAAQVSYVEYLKIIPSSAGIRILNRVKI